MEFKDLLLHDRQEIIVFEGPQVQEFCDLIEPATCQEPVWNGPIRLAKRILGVPYGKTRNQDPSIYFGHTCGRSWTYEL